MKGLGITEGLLFHGIDVIPKEQPAEQSRWSQKLRLVSSTIWNKLLQIYIKSEDSAAGAAVIQERDTFTRHCFRKSCENANIKVMC